MGSFKLEAQRIGEWEGWGSPPFGSEQRFRSVRQAERSVAYSNLQACGYLVSIVPAAEKPDDGLLSVALTVLFAPLLLLIGLIDDPPDWLMLAGVLLGLGALGWLGLGWGVA